MTDNLLAPRQTKTVQSTVVAQSFIFTKCLAFRFNAGSIMLKGRDIHPCFFQAGCGYDSSESGKDKARRQTDDSIMSKGTRETSKEDLSRSVMEYASILQCISLNN